MLEVRFEEEVKDFEELATNKIVGVGNHVGVASVKIK